MADDSVFTDEEIAFGEQYPTLGPDYERANRVAKRAMAAFTEEHFKPLTDEFAKAFADRLWDDVRDWLLGDTEMNLQSEMRHIAEATVAALLHGHRGYAKRYVLDDGLNAKKIRAAIFEQFKDEIIDKGIQERDAEIERLREALSYR